MSILLKGLKMPKGNNFVTIHVSSDGKWCDVWETELEGEAVEVPTPHGDLIDGDELYREVAKAHAYEHLSVKRIIATVRNSSTVIETEEWTVFWNRFFASTIIKLIDGIGFTGFQRWSLVDWK